ncbi:MAG: hypothetical protein WKF96_08860 [Solirubrobacteraceae bacterium]
MSDRPEDPTSRLPRWRAKPQYPGRIAHQLVEGPLVGNRSPDAQKPDKIVWRELTGCVRDRVADDPPPRLLPLQHREQFPLDACRARPVILGSTSGYPGGRFSG